MRRSFSTWWLMKSKWKILQKLPEDKRERIFLTTRWGFWANIAFAVAHGVFGAVTHSWWFLTLAAYYILLSSMKYSTILYERKHRDASVQDEVRVKRFVGILLLALAPVMIGTVVLTITQGIGTKYHEIVMIAMATYSFTKITLAIVNYCKTRKNHSPLLVAVRCISLANAFVSIFALQRSMLVTFEGMTAENIRLMNLLTGIGVCLILCALGGHLLKKDVNIENSPKAAFDDNKNDGVGI